MRLAKRLLNNLPLFALCIAVQLVVLHHFSPITLFNRRWPASRSRHVSRRAELYPLDLERKLNEFEQPPALVKRMLTFEPHADVELPENEEFSNHEYLRSSENTTERYDTGANPSVAKHQQDANITERDARSFSDQNSQHLSCNEPQRRRIAIAVTTAMRSRKLRDSIRNSWGAPEHLLRYNASLHFFIARARSGPFLSEDRKQEMRAHGDMVQLDFIDSYRNLSLKTVEMLRWFRHNCPNVTYILKQDDDTFVNLKRFSKSLTNFERANRRSFIAGLVFHKRKVVKNPKNRYYIPPSVYNHTYWPTVVTGPAYVVTSDVIDRLTAQHDSHTSPFIPFEDIYVTGILRSAAKITLHSVPGFGHRICSENRTISDTSGPASFHRVYAHNHPRLHQRLPCLKRRI